MHPAAIQLVLSVGAILRSVAHPRGLDALAVEALELELPANRRRMLWVGGGLSRRVRLEEAAAHLVRVVAAVVHAVALPPVGHAFLVLAHEHPVVAGVGGQQRRRRHRRVRLRARAVGLVRAVVTVGVAVAHPRLVDAAVRLVRRVAVELPDLKTTRKFKFKTPSWSDVVVVMRRLTCVYVPRIRR